MPLNTTCAKRSESLEFWGLGREGEVVTELLPQFERETGIHVDVQQIPWTAAHEKILTAHVGASLPDVAQVGNSWMSELVTIDAIVPLEETLVDRSDYFGGIWDTNVVNGTLYGIPWYVDTRLLFYRTDMIPTPPRTWSEWMAVMDKLKRENRSRDFYPIVMPTNEWPQPVILALQRGAVLVDEKAQARFDDPKFLEGFSFYVEMFRRGYAPAVSNTQVANIYQQFGEGHIGMWITGPWDVGNLRTRLTPEQQKTWSTAPLPSPDGEAQPGLSLAGGSSLVVTKRSKKQEAAKKLIAFLSRPDIQARFYELSGDLPARRSAWNAPGLVGDRELGAFAKQLERTVALPRLPEAENIVNLIAEHGQMAVRGQFTARDAALALDAKVDRMLEKRRWVVSRTAGANVAPRARNTARPSNESEQLATPDSQPELFPRTAAVPAAEVAASRCHHAGGTPAHQPAGTPAVREEMLRDRAIPRTTQEQPTTANPSPKANDQHAATGLRLRANLDSQPEPFLRTAAVPAAEVAASRRHHARGTPARQPAGTPAVREEDLRSSAIPRTAQRQPPTEAASPTTNDLPPATGAQRP